MSSATAGRVVRIAQREDLAEAARLLHDFNIEFDEPTPSPAELATRLRLLTAEDAIVLVAEDVIEGVAGVAVMRLRKAIWTTGHECNLAELYVAPEQRGRGIGRALVEAAIDVARSRGASTMDIGVDEPDAVARALYERLGFTNRTGDRGQYVMFVYERDI